jgi:hypothetical protein
MSYPLTNQQSLITPTFSNNGSLYVPTGFPGQFTVAANSGQDKYHDLVFSSSTLSNNSQIGYKIKLQRYQRSTDPIIGTDTVLVEIRFRTRSGASISAAAAKVALAEVLSLCWSNHDLLMQG